MNFLFPLYLAGALAIGIPIALHLIRRHTHRRTDFSTLMFLRDTPPKHQSRRHIERWPLLLLRCLALCLLALAFARPFFASVDLSATPDAARITILVDRSASMHRSDLWPRALSTAQKVLEKASATDRVNIMTFDTVAHPIFSFERWASLPQTTRAEVAQQALVASAPGWAGTDLGAALISAAETMREDESDTAQQILPHRRIVLITDAQRGAALDALRAYDWPGDLAVTLEILHEDEPTNAAIQRVIDSQAASDDPKNPIHLRVANAEDSKRDQFRVRWNAPDSPAVDLKVAPGGAQLIQAPARPQKATALLLEGDGHDFDNQLHIAPPLVRRANVLIFSDDAKDDPHGALFYLTRALGTTHHLVPALTTRTFEQGFNGLDPKAAHLIVMTGPLRAEMAEPLRQYLSTGRTLITTLRQPADAATWSSTLGLAAVPAHEATVDRYAMLGKIDLNHPLLKAFDDPRFSDFTKIHHWHYRAVDLSQNAGAHVLARFNNGDPAWVEFEAHGGRVILMTSDWIPADSQLALSSKFVPLLMALLEHSGGLPPQPEQFFVNDSVPLPVDRAMEARILRPNGEAVTIPTGDTLFTQTDLPGIYTLTLGGLTTSFAVNASPGESRTSPMDKDTFEQIGLPLHAPQSDADRDRKLKQQQREQFETTEKRQKIWRWAILGLIGVLLLETYLAGRPMPAQGDAP